MRANRILAVLSALIRCHDDYPLGMTRGDIRRAAQLPDDTEITRPTRDLRKSPYNLTIACVDKLKNGERVWRYRLHDVDAAKKILQNHSPSTAPQLLNGKVNSSASDVSPSASGASVGLLP